MILPCGRTALAINSLCIFMLFSKATSRSVAWTCLLTLTCVTGLGQSLHYLAGIRHECACSTPKDDSAHSCRDQTCPFVDAESNSTQDSEQQSSTPADCCSVCRLLGQLSNGHFHIAVEERHVQVVCRETLLDATLDSSVSYFDHSPRGPPCIL